MGQIANILLLTVSVLSCLGALHFLSYLSIQGNLDFIDSKHFGLFLVATGLF